MIAMNDEEEKDNGKTTQFINIYKQPANRLERRKMSK